MVNSKMKSLAIFCLRGGADCEDVLSKIALLDKIFKVLTEELVLKVQFPLLSWNEQYFFALR